MEVMVEVQINIFCLVVPGQLSVGREWWCAAS